MAVQYLKHSEIDFERWDHCIRQSNNGLPYAFSWYLNVVCAEHWDGLVLDDYNAVMPLPYNRKLFGIHQLYQPVLCQQLGIYSGKVVDFKHFEKNVPAKFRYIHQHLNYTNPNANLKSRTNLVLPLNRSFDDLFSDFSKSLRKRLRKLNTYEFRQTDDVDLVVNLYRSELEDKVRFGEHNYTLAKQLFKHVLEHKAGKIYSVYHEETCISAGMFLVTSNRIINLFGASSSDHNYPDSMAFLISEIIRTYSNSSFVFDFEGSEIPGVRDFFLSFGSTYQNYPVYQVNRLPWWLRWYKK